jgi:hypothetical protein
VITRAFLRAALVMGTATLHATLLYAVAVMRATVMG